MGKQTFRYVRYFAKWIGLVFVLAGVLLFILQFVPTYTGKGVVFVGFVVAGFIWALDTLWSSLNEIREIGKQIGDHRKPKSKKN